MDTPGTWGFHAVPDGVALVDHYRRFIAAVVDSSAVVGFCWTQFTDIEQEANGLVDATRRPKAEVAKIREATLQPASREPRTRLPVPEQE